MAPRTKRITQAGERPAKDDLFGEFEFVDDTPGQPGMEIDPVQHRRDTMLKAIQDQLKLWDDPSYTVTKYTKSTDPETGKMYNTRTEKPPRKWWKEWNGKVYLRPKYGSRDLELKPGKPVAQLSEAQVEPFLNTLYQAVERGDFDDKLEKLAYRPSRK